MNIRNNKLVLASGNQGKIAELQAILSPLNIEVLAQARFNTPEADETGLSFIENFGMKEVLVVCFDDVAVLAGHRQKLGNGIFILGSRLLQLYGGRGFQSGSQQFGK